MTTTLIFSPIFFSITARFLFPISHSPPFTPFIRLVISSVHNILPSPHPIPSSSRPDQASALSSTPSTALMPGNPALLWAWTFDHTLSCTVLLSLPVPPPPPTDALNFFRAGPNHILTNSLPPGTLQNDKYAERLSVGVENESYFTHSNFYNKTDIHLKWSMKERCWYSPAGMASRCLWNTDTSGAVCGCPEHCDEKNSEATCPGFSGKRAVIYQQCLRGPG